MGIQGLTKLLTDNTKTAVREVKYDSYFGRKVAIDASMHIYQFMVRHTAESEMLFVEPDSERQYAARPSVHSSNKMHMPFHSPWRYQAPLGLDSVHRWASAGRGWTQRRHTAHERGWRHHQVRRQGSPTRLPMISKLCQQLTTCSAFRSHLQGMFNRTVRMLDAGIRPVYGPYSQSLCGCLFPYTAPAACHLTSSLIAQLRLRRQAANPEERRAGKAVRLIDSTLASLVGF